MGPSVGERLDAELPALRELTLQDAHAFRDRMRDICAACGVAVVFVPELPGSRASGVARWLTPVKTTSSLPRKAR